MTAERTDTARSCTAPAWPFRWICEDNLLWQNVGLRGEVPEGGADPAWRGRHGERNALFTDGLVHSGMRLGEGSLLVPEVPPLAGWGSSGWRGRPKRRRAAGCSCRRARCASFTSSCPCPSHPRAPSCGESRTVHDVTAQRADAHRRQVGRISDARLCRKRVRGLPSEGIESARRGMRGWCLSETIREVLPSAGFAWAPRPGPRASAQLWTEARMRPATN